MHKTQLILFLSIALLTFSCASQKNNSQTSINIALGEQGEDMTLIVRQELEKVSEFESVTIELEQGTYYFKPELAFEQYTAITNHGNGVKKIAFPLNNFKKIKIKGNGAKLIFHSQMMPFLFRDCTNIEVSNLTIDWDIPFTFLAEVIAVDPQGKWREVKPRSKEDGFSWKLEKGAIKFPDIDGFSYSEPGSTLAFDPNTKRPIVGALDLHSNPTKVEQLDNGNLKIYEKLRQMPPIGSLLSSKGDRKNDRYAPAFDFIECKDITLDNVTVNHALGMAFLFERSENITLKNSTVGLSKDSNRVIASTADASHFANCKGKVLIENCKFENMLDDGTNVHGTYMKIEEIVSPRTVRASFNHFEQEGFKFADSGDEIWFIIAPSPDRATVGIVKRATALNEKIYEIEFIEELPSNLKVADILENKSWNPEFTMRGCTIQNHRARAVIIKSPLKTVIENNYLSSMMSGVLLRGESKFWFESGAVQDVLIQNNTFHNAADCGSKHAALYITPIFGEGLDNTATYDKNIRFINNKINSFNPRAVIAENVEGLLIQNNSININSDHKASFPNAPTFELTNCKDVVIKNNTLSGKEPVRILNSDNRSQKTLTTDF